MELLQLTPQIGEKARPRYHAYMRPSGKSRERRFVVRHERPADGEPKSILDSLRTVSGFRSGTVARSIGRIYCRATTCARYASSSCW